MESSRPWAMWLQGPTWPWREQASIGHQVRKRERETFFVPLGLYWVWDGPGALSKEPINFPSFPGLLIGSSPS